jgi:hypothetical protein
LLTTRSLVLTLPIFFFFWASPYVHTLRVLSMVPISRVIAGSSQPTAFASAAALAFAAPMSTHVLVSLPPG